MRKDKDGKSLSIIYFFLFRRNAIRFQRAEPGNNILFHD